jgi:hypothetical protein
MNQRHTNLRLCRLSIAVCIGCTCTIVARDAQAGVLSIAAINGNHVDTQLLTSPPASTDEDALTGKVYAFDEKSDLVLGSNLSVDVGDPGIPGNYSTALIDMFGIPGGTVPAGTHVDSFLIHFDITGEFAVTAEFRVDTDAPILGVIFSDSRLDDSDILLGATGTVYPNGLTDRGTAAASDEGSDAFSVGFPGDIVSTTMIITMQVQAAVDQIRVITAVPEPSIAALLASGALAVLAACGWRRLRSRDGQA